MIHATYRAAGLPCFPCWVRPVPNGGGHMKGPSVEKGTSWKDAALAPVEKFDWSSGVIGVPIPEGVYVIDADRYKNPHLRAEAEAYLGCALPWDAALIQTTISGGEHYAFRVSRPLRQINDLAGAPIGFDSRAAGRGFICAGQGYTPHGQTPLGMAYPGLLPELPAPAQDRLARHDTPAPPPQPHTPADMQSDDIVAALAFIDPGCQRAEWVRVGLALRNAFKDDEAAGREVFDRWSSGEFWPGDAPENYVAEHIDGQWSSFKPDGDVTAATLYYRAIQGGWRPTTTFDTAAAFGAGSVSADVFEALIGKIRQDGADMAAVPALVADIQSAGCSPLQVALLAAELKTELRDAGVKDKAVEKQIDGLLAAPAVPASFGGYLTPEEQGKVFAGCVYIQDSHRIFSPHGLLKPEQFNVRYGGHVFLIGTHGSGKTTRKAFEAFTENRIYSFPKVKGTCFRPELQTGVIVSMDGEQFVNTFKPIYGERTQGDVGPFLNHVSKLLPHEEDREIFLSFLAAVVQQPGTKFQWTVLLQGAEGNGKTLFYRVLSYCLNERYCHTPGATDITNPFNGWIEDKLLIGIEELHVRGRQEVADALKPMITNDRIEIHRKGLDQRTGTNCANFILFSNHKDAVLKNENDRRYCVFYSAQQEASDLDRDGMTGEYFSRLYDWLNAGGYANVAHYLATREIHVDTSGRAPATSSTAEAIRASAGAAEHILMEAVELGDYGFCGDMICTRQARETLKQQGMRLSPHKVTEALSNIGYLRHPGLKSGKVSIEGIKRRLYVKRGSSAAALREPADIATAWLQAQRGLSSDGSNSVPSDWTA